MILIIAEKPSLARNIVNAIGNMKKCDGYYENKDYVVTFAFGHLFSLCDIEDYNNSKDKTWKIDNLPCFPDEFKFQLKKDRNGKIDTGILKQFNIIKVLCNREDCCKIVNAGDADREGEIIVRLCINNALQTKKEITRLWLPDQTQETILEALSSMKPDSFYNNLANEGLARTYIDWLYGVNLTRYASLKTGTLLRVGRVIIPIVKAIYDRDKQIEEFQKETYYSVCSKELTNNEVIELNSKEKCKTKEEALELSHKYNQCLATVVSKKIKKDIINPSKLYSLSKLQSMLGKRYKMSMDKSLNIVQGLYEKGYLTYPRTNSEYLATNEKNKIKTIINNFSKLGYQIEFKDKKSIFDDSKIESHSALTPTYNVPDKSSLTTEELIVYKTVLQRFIAVFTSEDCTCEKTEIIVKLSNLEEFSLKGTVIINKGFTKYEEYMAKDKLLPKLDKGDIINIKFEPIEKQTTPPKHYTIETLNNYLKNPFKDDKNKLKEDDDSLEYKAIFEGLELGTEATRTSIIDNAIKSNYIELKKDVYYIKNEGKYLIDAVKQMNIAMDKYKTSELGKALKKVYHDEMTINDSVGLAKNEISEVFKLTDKSLEEDIDTGFYKDIVGKCPKCKNDVIKSKYAYSCINYKNGCDFKVNLIICKRVISKANVKLLLEIGRSSKIKGFISKNNKVFDAYLVLKDGKVSFEF